MNQIEIYKTEDGRATVEVRFGDETLWLSLNQIATLFGRDKSVISRHLRNIYKEGELKQKATVAKNATVQIEAGREVKRDIEYYNLDAIISVGYRVNSKRGTQFRQWATQRLKDYLIKGYVLNEKRLQQAEGRYHELQKAIQLITKASAKKSLTADESKGILTILEEYSHALDILDKYDHQQLTITPSKEKVKKLTYAEAIMQIKTWRETQQSGKLFGKEKDDSLKSSLETIYQTFDRKELYPGIKLKAAHLLYFIVKNHSFTDGNKRIAAGLFVYFLHLNKILFKQDGSKIIDDNALVALTLLIAESQPGEKNIMIKLIVNLIK
jgi:prophage maintenance system killer protein